MTIIRRIGRILLFVLGSLIALIATLLLVLLVPQDRTIDRTAMLDRMKGRVDSLDTPAPGGHSFLVGFARENITPVYRTATAGYGNRLGKRITSVHDSIYVRTIVIDNGVSKAAIVSVDMLMMPPAVAAMLERELPQAGFSADNTFLGATHSHNSIGNWSRGAMTVMYGAYDDSIVYMVKDRVLSAIRRADASKVAASISSAHLPVAGAVRNRISVENPVDSLLRVVEIKRADSTKLVLMNFTAHATCLSSGNLALSADYPGRLTQALEAHGYAFAMFMAGAVGSHAAKTKEREWPCVEEMAGKMTQVFTENTGNLQLLDDKTLWTGRVRLDVSEPQFKLFKTWRLRPWAFNKALGDFPEYLTVLRMGNLLMLGAPCDLSGEFYPRLDSAAAANGMTMMVAGFNGGYMGYITPDRYYDEDHYETQLMNWYGPGNGEYLVTCMEMLIAHASR